MDLVIYKHYSNKEQLEQEMQSNAKNRNQTIAYMSGSEDIMTVLKELIKTAYPQ